MEALIQRAEKGERRLKDVFGLVGSMAHRLAPPGLSRLPCRYTCPQLFWVWEGFPGGQRRSALGQKGLPSVSF